MRSQFLLFLFLLHSLFAATQDVRGNWKGKIYSPGSADSTVIEIKIYSAKKEALTGKSTCFFEQGYYAIATLSVAHDSIKNEIHLRELRIIDKNLPQYMPSLFLQEFFLSFSGGKKLTGIARCIRSTGSNESVRTTCHDDMYIDLTKL